MQRDFLMCPFFCRNSKVLQGKYKSITLYQVKDMKTFSRNNENKYDAITMLDVLEHIQDQKKTLSYMKTMLKPNGILIITVPQKYILSFLDTGNWKFIFPTLHKYFITLIKGKKHFYNYFQNPNNPLFGDIEKTKMWHEHFSVKSLTELLNNSGFLVLELDGSGFFTRLINIIIYFLPPIIRGPLKKLDKLDNKTFQSANLYCYAKSK